MCNRIAVGLFALNLMLGSVPSLAADAALTQKIPAAQAVIADVPPNDNGKFQSGDNNVAWITNDLFVVAWYRPQSATQTDFTGNIRYRLFHADGTAVSNELIATSSAI